MTAPSPSPAPRPAGQDDPARSRAGRLLLWQSAALLAMVGAFGLVLPWKLLAAVFALAALALGVRLWTLGRPGRDARPARGGAAGQPARPGRGAGAPSLGRARAAGTLGMALALFGLLVSALPLLAWDETVRLEQCAASSVTVRAQQACTTEFTRSVESRTGLAQLGD